MILFFFEVGEEEAAPSCLTHRNYFIAYCIKIVIPYEIEFFLNGN
jgi:hypothetical protein